MFFRRRLHLAKRVTLKGDLVDAVEQFLKEWPIETGQMTHFGYVTG